METFASPFLAAPMAGVSDLAFRMRLRRNGCRALWTEMISAAALYRRHRESLRMADPADRDDAMAVQLFGAKPEELAPATRELTRMGWRRVDLNMGCPVKKVVKTGGGAALMRDPALAEACISAMRAEIQGVFTVKIRLGWDASNQNCLEIAQLAARCGVDGVILHGRTRAQGYGGVADWTRVRELSGASGIPLAGNGDIADPQTALERLRDYGVAAVMIGRAGVSSPWIFRDMHLLEQGRPLLGTPRRKRWRRICWNNSAISRRRRGNGARLRK